VLVPDQDVERRCNQVAVELLVPLDVMRQEYDGAASLPDEVSRLARRFKVSTLVILRRIHDAGGMTRQEFWNAYHAEVERLLAIPRGSGGNFYLTQAARVSKRFAAALVTSTLEGRTLYNDAFRMLGFSKQGDLQGTIASASTKKIKIPNASIGLGVKCMTPFEMLRHERARFILGPQP